MKRSRQRYCQFYPYLYVGEGVRNVRLVKWRLVHGAGQLTVFLLAEAPGMPESLCLMHAANLKQAYYETHPLRVYGIARGEDEARRMLIAISDEAARCGYPGEIRRYLDERLKRESGT